MTILLQALLNGLMTGSLIAVPAIGFTAIFAVLRFADFAIAAYATIGAFAAWVVNARLGWSGVSALAPALAVAFIVAGGIAALAEQIALRPLRGGGALTVAIGSIALNLVLENAVRFLFGNDMHGYDLPIRPDLRFWGLRVGLQQIANFASAVAIMGTLAAFLKLTMFGRALRAVADNPELARLKGINPDLIAAITLFLGAGLSGVGGVMIGLDSSIDPLTGYRVLLAVFASAVLGGLGSIPGAVLGALALGIAEELALIVVAPSYRTAIGFVAIFVVLTVKPGGLLGERSPA